MRLETIRDFEWYNEPEFGFDAGCMRIKAAPQTDFWQDNRHNIRKDNGHFFFSRRNGNFTLTVKWQTQKDQPRWCQYGLMGRIDNNNWCKYKKVSWITCSTSYSTSKKTFNTFKIR